MDSFRFPSDRVLNLNEATPFGKNLLAYFQIDPSVTNVNHGSYGASPRVVTDALRHYEDRMEQNPDGWFRFEYEQLVSRVIDELRRFVNVSDGQSSEDGPGVGDLVLVRNASFAINSIFRSWPWHSGDKLLYLSEAYDMVKYAGQFLHDSLGVEVIEVPIRFPITDEAVVDLVTAALDQHGGAIKLAVFSHISSVPAVILPAKPLVDLCRRRNVTSVIDGAHTLGQIDVDLTELDPDFYLSNGHKWLMSSKGSAIMYSKSKWRPMLHSTVITFGYKDPQAKREFFWQGTGDYSAWLTFPTAIKFRQVLGEQRIRAYCRRLAWDAGRLMAEIWATEMLVNDANQLGSMNNIRLPLEVTARSGADEKFVERVIKELYLQYKTYLAHFCQDGIWYARISAQIYNDLEDYRMVANGFLKVRDQLIKPDQESEEKRGESRRETGGFYIVEK